MFPKCSPTISLAIPLVSIAGLIVLLMISAYSGTNNNSSNAYAQSSEALPTYIIRIHPSTFEEGVTHYDPQQAAVPTGTTVEWINDDYPTRHTVTSGMPGEQDKGKSFDSGEMPAGSKYQLTLDSSTGLIGKLPYYCTLHPWITGTISANDTVVGGQNFEFKSGTGPTLNTTENSRTLLAFNPIGVQVNQDNPFSYNFTIIRDSDNKTLFSRDFQVERNDFEIELIDFAEAGEQQPTTPPVWFGPEISTPYTGAYHLAGDITNGNYTLAVELERIGANPPEHQIRDEFPVQVVS